MKRAAKKVAELIKKFWQAFCRAMQKFTLILQKLVKQTGAIMLVTSMVMNVVAYMLEYVPEVQMLNQIIQVLFGIYILVWIVMNVDARWAEWLERMEVIM